MVCAGLSLYFYWTWFANDVKLNESVPYTHNNADDYAAAAAAAAADDDDDDDEKTQFSVI